MGRQAAVALYVAAMVAVIVGVDFAFLQKPILGTADSEYWRCLGVRSFLLKIPQASMKFGCLIKNAAGDHLTYWKVIMSVRLSVGAFGFKGWFVMLPLR